MAGVQSSHTPGECCLCNRNCSQLSTPSTWKDTSSKVLAESLGVGENSAVCRACRQDIKWLMHNPTLIPRWSKHTKKRCCVTGCSAECFCETEVMSADELSSTLGIELRLIPKPTPLCKTHYHRVYNTLKIMTQTSCATCNTSLKGGVTRSCPSPAVIQHHPQEKTGFEGMLTPDSRVCFACYKVHLQLIHEETNISNDASLLAIIEELQQLLPQTANMTTIDAVKEYAMIRTTILVGETILRQEALLLPAVHNYYAQTAYQCIQASTQLTQSRPPKSLVTARYILSHLSMTLKQHLSYTCQLKKYGTLLY